MQPKRQNTSEAEAKANANANAEVNANAEAEEEDYDDNEDGPDESGTQEEINGQMYNEIKEIADQTANNEVQKELFKLANQYNSVSNNENTQSDSTDETDEIVAEILYKLAEDALKNNKFKLRFKYLLLSAQYGYGPAVGDIAESYYLGRGVPIDYVRAREWFYEAIEIDENDDLSYYALGLMYSNGSGVEVDMNQAISFIQKASELGNEEASESLQELIKDL